jgi:hypothetical protein
MKLFKKKTDLLSQIGFGMCRGCLFYSNNPSMLK